MSIPRPTDLPSTRMAEPTPEVERKIKIVLVGDSTVAERTGWGLGFKEFLVSGKTECINAARGGRSSLSYLKERLWADALAVRGDFYLFQFGHNNQPGKPGRSTDLATFVANLRRYVDDTRSIGAKPILITPLTRRQWDEVHPAKIRSTLEPYAVEIRKLAAEMRVPLVDLHARSIELCEQLGREKCHEFSPMMVMDGRRDHDDTHIRGVGRVLFARRVAQELGKAVPELTSVLLAEPREANPKIPEDAFDAVVSHDISADYKDLQSAIEAAPDQVTHPFRILLKSGIYHGQFIVPKAKSHVELIGENVAETVVSCSLNAPATTANTTQNFAGAGLIVLANDFLAENITFQNQIGVRDQTLAVRVEGDRAGFKNCRLIGRHETLLLAGSQTHLAHCLIEGGPQAVSGSAQAVFDQCKINHSSCQTPRSNIS